MRFPRDPLGIVVCFTLAIGGGSLAHAADAQVRLEVVADGAASVMELQSWGQVLSQAGVNNARLRSATVSEQPKVETLRDAGGVTYVVTAVVSGSELLVPGAHFRRGEAGMLANWLKDLAAKGPPESREAIGAFGLTGSQFDQARKQLASPVGFATDGQPCDQVVHKLADQLGPRLMLTAAAEQAIGSEPVTVELSGVARGTALAFLLRPSGYGLVPQQAGAEIEYVVVPMQPKTQIWPVGWEPAQPLREVLPAANEFLDVNVQNVPARQALAAIADRLHTPALLDTVAVARRQLDPEKLVSMPKGRTTYSIALRKLLFQAGFKHEIRVDDGDRPLLWVTSVKPI